LKKSCAFFKQPLNHRRITTAIVGVHPIFVQGSQNRDPKQDQREVTRS